MKIMKKTFIPCTLALSLLLAGCAENISPNSYEARDTGQVNRTEIATIISMRAITINNSTGAGGLVGAAAGAVAGSAIGGSSRANILGGIGGAVAGGLLGNAVEKGIGKKTGMEYVLRTKGGKLLTVTQTQDLQLQVGQKVFVILGERTRIVPANV